MSNLPVIGFIGFGFVGKAVANAYIDSKAASVLVKDPAYPDLSVDYKTLLQCNAIFLCLPTPSNEDGSCNTTILTEVITNLEDLNYTGIIICKSTAPPDYYKNLEETTSLNLVYVPEFLRERFAEADYKQAQNRIIGFKFEDYDTAGKATKILELADQNIIDYTYVGLQEASYIKYLINSFLATKVVFMHEAALLAENLNLDWNRIKSVLAQDSRIGKSHLQAPGIHGYGFGGTCFPKDTAALAQLSERKDSELKLLKAAIKINKGLTKC